MQLWLNDWLMNYVDGDPSVSTEATKARRPLAAAEVRVEDVEDDPGYYRAHFYLRPHYQLEGMTVSLRLVSKLRQPKRWEQISHGWLLVWILPTLIIKWRG